MKHTCACPFQFFCQNSFVSQTERFCPYAMGTVHLPYLLIAGILHRYKPFPAKGLHYKAVQILRSRPDTNLLRRNDDIPASRQVVAKCIPQLRRSLIGRAGQHLFAPFGEHCPCRFRINGKGKYFFIRLRRKNRLHFLSPVPHGKSIFLFINDKVAAPFPRFDIPFFRKKRIRMLHGDDTHAIPLRHGAFGRQLAAPPVNPAGNRFTDTGIKRHICFFFHTTFHLASIWLYFYFHFW